MLVYIVKRLLLLPLLLFIFSVVAFILIQAPPGDFVTSYVAELAASGSSMDRMQIEALRNLYGLDQPYYIQYFKWIARILQGDFGVSLDWQKPISELIGQRLLLTLTLGLFTLIFTFAVAVPIGIISATRQYSFYDYFFTVFNYLGVATPTLHDRAGPDVAGLLLLQPHDHRPVLAGICRRALELRPGRRPGHSTSGCRS